ncbi:heat shock 70 kDa protein 16 [Sesamum indicum]|uniref:Heat shock 70 kDa protein 16 n=1 Tax=Sesamum indicum TaxID=4182 RepID=A0A6I9U991_SESIN|nr:heat shock 70 kDa protein 16 [Sesamum indicum]XP_011096074.1 heat shock 70 kDa protein 16 [Sesamum indicum]XP_011096075.1 heat shock 70 kDa protein 16 [Sesamum indicum]
MSVVGFDIGNENCVIAVAKERGIDVLLNDESKRENPAVVSFGEKQRFIGCAGAASATMHPKSTISQVKRLIGRTYSEPTVQDDLRLLPFETSEGPDGGILIHLQYLDEKQTFTPIQILAMLLAHLKQITEKNLEKQITNCVIGIPSYFTALQRRAYLHAAEIAGLKPLRLMHDCTAIGLGYGIYKTEFPSKGPANVVFVDVGHSDTQVAIVSFEPGHMKVLSHAFDSNLGGRDFDEVLFRHFAAEFRQQYKIDVYSSARASIRLRASCEKLKKVLSANPEAPLNIECLMEEKDVKGHIKRDEFEKLASALLERISIPCRKALHDSGLTVDKIHTVELVGSGSRIPAITKILTSLFRKEPSRTLNASECVARGCALQCAMLSPIFRVREYEVQDCFPFSISFASDEGPVCSLTDGVLFPKGTAFPSTKMLTLHRNDIFHMEAFYANQKELPSGVSTRISSSKIGPFRVSHVEKSRIKIKVQLDLHGIVSIVSASLVDDQVDDATVKNNGDTLSENVGPGNHESFIKPNGTSGHEIRRLKAIRRQDIFIAEDVYGGMTQGELSQAQEKELQLAEQDLKVERTKEKKNALEAYVYESRNKLLSTYRSFATDSEKEGISSNLQQTEEWLYDDGDDESEYVYTEKLDDLKKMVDPIEIRYKEEEARAVATRELLNCIVEYRMAVASLPSSERDAVIGECNKAEQWLREKSHHQDSLPKNADPILWSGEIKRKSEALDAMYKHVMRSRESDTRSKRDDMQVD